MAPDSFLALPDLQAFSLSIVSQANTLMREYSPSSISILVSMLLLCSINFLLTSSVHLVIKILCLKSIIYTVRHYFYL